MTAAQHEKSNHVIGMGITEESSRSGWRKKIVDMFHYNDGDNSRKDMWVLYKFIHVYKLVIV